MRTTAAVRLFVGAAALVVLTGCTQVVEGVAARAPGGPAPGEVDPTLLDPGNYPTEPQPALGAAGSPKVGARVEAARMASAVVGPWEVDDRLDDSKLPNGIISFSDGLGTLLSPLVAEAAARNQFVTAFVSNRADSDNEQALIMAVLRFRDDQSAATAAREMLEAALVPPDDPESFLPTAAPATIPGHPDTLASWEETDFPSRGPTTSVQLMTARGPFVLYQWARTTENLETVTALAATALDQQIPRIDEFAPTEVNALADLPVDPDGLLARTLPAPKEFPALQPNGLTFDRAGALHFQSEPLTATTLFDQTNMDQWAYGGISVYQAGDVNGADQIVDQFVAESQEQPGMDKAEPVPNFPGSHCSRRQDGEGAVVMFTCFAAADRYAFEATSAQLVDAQQQVAAQYLMLTAK